MNIKTTLKFTLFSLISALICVCAYAITQIDIIILISELFFFVAYFTFILWFCRAIHGKNRYSANWISIIAPLSVALYSGVRNFGFDTAQDIDLIAEWTLTDLVFVVSSLITLICIIGFVWRLIFGKAPQQEIEEQEAAPLETEEAPTNSGTWICECGKENTGKFCSECGKPANNTANS